MNNFKYSFLLSKKYLLVYSVLFAILIVSLFGCGGGGGDSSSLLPSKTATITGMVSKSIAPYSLRAQSASYSVERAKVWLEKYPNISTFTDTQGLFALTNVPPGLHNVVARLQEGNTVFKMREQTSVEAEMTKEIQITVYEAKNVVSGILRDENGIPLKQGTKLSLWGESFEVESNGSFTTPPLPDLELDKALNEIVVFAGSSNEIKISTAFASPSHPAELDILVPLSQSSASVIPSVSLIAIYEGKAISEIGAKKTVTLRAIVFPFDLSNQDLQWECTTGELNPNTSGNGNTREKLWTSPSKGTRVTITVSASTNTKTSRAKIHLDVQAPQLYRIYYNGNNNTSGNPPQDQGEYEENQLVTLLDSNTLAKNDYFFSSWNTKQDGTGNNYNISDSFYMPSHDLTLYAIWTWDPTYRILYYNNHDGGGTVPVDPTKYRPNTPATILGNTGNLRREGYVFNGWNTQREGKELNLQEGEEIFFISSDIRLYASWKPIYNVRYFGNYPTTGADFLDPKSYLENDEVIILDKPANMAKHLYTFIGWNTQSDGYGITLRPGAIINMPGKHFDLFAKWSPNPTYKITYDRNGGSGEPFVDPNNYEADELVTIFGAPSDFVRTSFRFINWNTHPAGTGDKYEPSDELKMPQTHITLFAQWLPEFNIVYDPNGSYEGYPPFDSKGYIEGEEVEIFAQPQDMLRAGYKFTGWNTNPNGTGEDYTAGKKLTMKKSNITLYARWVPIYRVYYDGNDHTSGKPPVDSKEYEANETTTVKGPETLIKDGYEFATWNTERNGSGKGYGRGAILTISSQNITLYAQWKVSPLISTANVVISPPIVGATPPTAAQIHSDTNHPDYTVSTIKWNEELQNGVFKASQKYSAIITLTSKNNKYFQAAPFIPVVYGASSVSTTETAGTGTGNTVSFIVNWSQTEQKALLFIEVTEQPSLRYKEFTNNLLDVSGTRILEHYNDKSTKLVIFSNEIPEAYSCDPSPGTILEKSKHDGKSIIITHIASGKTAETAKLIVELPDIISNVSLSLQLPETGLTPRTLEEQATRIAHPDYELASFTWIGDLTPYSTFRASQIYSVFVRLKSKNSKMFSEQPFTPSVSGSKEVTSTLTEGVGPGNTISFTVTYNETSPLTLERIEVTTQPTKMIYTDVLDCTLDLDGMEITEFFNDKSSRIVKFISGSADGYETSPFNGSTLNTSYHDKTIKVTHQASGIMAETARLKVLTPQMISEAIVVIPQPLEGTPLPTLQYINSQTNSSVFDVTSITYNHTATPEGNFKAGTSYEADVMLTSKNGNIFQATPFTPVVQHAKSVTVTQTSGETSGNSVIFTVTWETTSPLILTNFEILTQPRKMQYVAEDDDILTLNGMQIIETYNDLSTKIINVEYIMPQGYISDPEIGYALKLTDNGIQIKITCDELSLTKNTQPLVVNDTPPEEISAILLVMTKPIAGSAPQSAEEIQVDTNNEQYLVSQIKWNEELTESGYFKANTAYSATIKLKSNYNYTFAQSSYSPTVQGSSSVSSTQTQGNGVGNELQFTVNWSQTDTANVIDFAIQKQPNKLSYKEIIDDTLTLNGMELLLTLNDYSTTVLTFANDMPSGYQSDPQIGTKLTQALHNNTTVKITHIATSIQKETSALSVLYIPPEEITSALVQMSPPKIGELPQDIAAIQNATNHDDYTVESIVWSPTLPVNNRFIADTVYSSTLTLKSKNGKTFSSTPFTPTVSGSESVGQTTTSGSGVGNKVSFSVNWPKTGPVALVGFVISIQPKLNYTVTIDNVLSLSSMKLTETYNDHSSKLVSFDPSFYTAFPPDGSILTKSDDNSTVAVTHKATGLVKYTQNLSVEDYTPVQLSSIAVSVQPSKLSYTEGETLNLSGMIVIETYTDSTTKNIAFTSGTATGYSASPAHGTLLSASTHNNIQITVTHNSSGKSAKTGNITVGTTAPPDPPTNLSVKPSAKNKLKITWSPVSGAEYYSVYSSEYSDSGFTKIAGGITTTDYEQDSLTSGKKYFFKLKTVKSSIESDFSSVVSAIVNIDEAGPVYNGNKLIVLNYSTSLNFQNTGTLSSISPSPDYSMSPTLNYEAYRENPIIPYDGPLDPPDILFNQNILGDTILQSQVGDARQFNVTSRKTSQNYKLNATLLYVGNKVEIWAETDNPTVTITSQMAQSAGVEFDNVIYPLITTNFYEPSDVNQDGKIAILLFDIEDDFTGPGTSYTSGYFWGGDLHGVSSSNPNSNEMEIFYVDTYPTMGTNPSSPDVSKAFSTIVHEFQHMVNYNRNRLVTSGLAMDTWLNEALSLASEHLYEGTLSNRITYYNGSNAIKEGRSLIDWVSNDALPNYSLSYLFAIYIKTQVELVKGSSIKPFREMIESDHRDYKAVEELIQKYISPSLTFNEFAKNFRLALALKATTGYYGFGGDSDFNLINPPIFTGSSVELKGTGTVIKTITAPFTEPSNKGQNIRYIGIFN